jgi:hypothetical protein
MWGVRQKVFEKLWRERASRECEGRCDLVKGRVRCFGLVEVGEVDWAEIGIRREGRGIEGNCGGCFDDKAWFRMIGGVVGATTTVNMSQR